MSLLTRRCLTWSVLSATLACSGATAANPETELAMARSRWRQAAVRHYRMQVQVRCFCPLTDPVVVEVQGQRVLSLVHADSTAAAADTLAYANYITVERLFTLVDAAIAGAASRLEVRYDRRLGYVLDLDVDPDPFVVDEQFGATVTGWTQLP